MQKNNLWVVYQMTVRGKLDGAQAVCEQDEWDAMELARPGFHTLVREGITGEAEAEKLARAGSAVAGMAKLSSAKVRA